jgi:tetratricopeptide (TPR) repeat protein
VLEICESIFNLPKLSEKSFALLWAHDISGMLYERFEDNHNALVHYKRAAQLRCKHHSPDNSVISHDKMQIALIFTKLEHLDAAIKMFEEVIELGHPRDIGIAYERMGLIYRLKGDNDMAFYCFTKSLEIAIRDVSTDFGLIVKNHIHLAEIEYIWKNFDQVDAHMSEALAMSSNSQFTERTKNEIEVALDQFRTLTTHGHMTTQGMAICDRKHFS